MFISIRRVSHAAFAIGYLSIVMGCAVTEPTTQDKSRVVSAIEDDPATSIEQLSQEFGISQLAVVRAIPTEYARRWDVGAEQAWLVVQGWPMAAIRSRAAFWFGDPQSVEIKAFGDNAPVYENRMYIDQDWSEIEAVWLIRKPSASGGVHGVWWFDASGEAVLRVSLPGVGPSADEVEAKFEKLWLSAGQVSP